jgi:hypothetical protein
MNEPLLQETLNKIKNSLQQKLPVLFLENTDSSRRWPSLIASSDPRFRQNLFDLKKTVSLCVMRFLIFIRHVPEICQKAHTNSNFYRVEMYNYAIILPLLHWLICKQKNLLLLIHSRNRNPIFRNV